MLKDFLRRTELRKTYLRSENELRANLYVAVLLKTLRLGFVVYKIGRIEDH